jgi:pyridoxamine 5'-phosphate oxidase
MRLLRARLGAVAETETETETEEPDPVYAQRRVAYVAPAFEVDDLADHPLAQFERWYADAAQAGVAEPNAMVLATADAAGAPGGRTVLLKHADGRGFVFYTSYASRKAAEIEAHPEVALVFPWVALARQVCVRGTARRVDRDETRAYFVTRPWDSRIGAWASHQSAPLAARAELVERWEVLARRWPDRGRADDVPVPDHWGGYVVAAHEVEFWQGRPSRLHDRLVYRADGPAALDDPASWRVERRQP